MVLELLRNVSKIYIPPNRKLIHKELPDFIHEENMKRNLAMIKKKAEIFELLFLGDAATISRFPLLNSLAYAESISVSVSEIVDCQGHLVDVNKTDGTFIFNPFLNHMKKIDPAKKLSDIVMFDGA